MLGPKEKDTKKGWCEKRSKYPHSEGPGQVFPPNVARVAHGELAKPFIVKKEQVVPSCTTAQLANFDPVKAKRVGQTQLDAKGKRILA